MTMDHFRSRSPGPALRRSVRNHPRSMGDDPAAIAEHLAPHSVRGVPGLANDCAVSRYLQALTSAEGAVGRIVVTQPKVRLSVEGRRLPVGLRRAWATSGFIGAFDAGRYPHLVDQLRTSSAGTNRYQV